MPDLLASASLLPLTPAIAPRTASVAVPVVADFMAMLGELVLPPGGKPQGGKGQALAGGGKDLPVGGNIAADEEDAGDPVIGWLPGGLVPLPVESVAGTAGEDGFAAAPVVEAIALLPGATAAAEAPSAAQVEIAPVVAADGESKPVEMPAATIEAELVVKAEAPAPERPSRATLAPVVTPQPVVPGAPATQTAGQVFAAAMSASFDSPATPRVTDPAAVQVQAAAAEQLRTTVQAMSGADQALLDMSRDDWAGKMVDRIATLRDAAEAADTRIRLAPENLGNVEVSIRREGDRLHVHFTAESPAARQLLAEAAPRLAELADARGVKLGQTSVDAGTGGQHGQSNQPQSNQPARPAASSTSGAQSNRDDRVA